MPEQTGCGKHAPTLLENSAELKVLAAKIDSLRDLIEERDRLYKERADQGSKAVDAALAAAKEQTKQSFDASEKAIGKAEGAQNEYNARSNEFRGQLDDQAKRLISRLEVEAMIRNMEEKIGRIDSDVRGLRETRQGTIELSDRSKQDGNQMMWAIGLLVAIVLGLASLAIGGAALFRVPHNG